MNSRGQFWSLDIVVAAAVFTLAIGLILSSSELSIFYSQQEKNSQQLLSAAILSSNNLMSRSDIILQFTPPECNPVLGGDADLCTINPFSCGPGCNKLDISLANLNARCGPNPIHVASFPIPLPPPAPQTLPTLSSYPRGWVADNELSGLENCIVDYNTAFRRGPLGIFSEYNFDLNAILFNQATISYYMSKLKNEEYFSIKRRALVFDTVPTASNLRECLDGGCAAYLTDVNLNIWRI